MAAVVLQSSSRVSLPSSERVKENKQEVFPSAQEQEVQVSDKSYRFDSLKGSLFCKSQITHEELEVILAGIKDLSDVHLSNCEHLTDESIALIAQKAGKSLTKFTIHLMSGLGNEDSITKKMMEVLNTHCPNLRELNISGISLKGVKLENPWKKLQTLGLWNAYMSKEEVMQVLTKCCFDASPFGLTLKKLDIRGVDPKTFPPTALLPIYEEYPELAVTYCKRV